MDCRPCKKENACIVTGLLEATVMENAKKLCNVLMCSRMPPCALLNEPRAYQELVYALYVSTRRIYRRMESEDNC
jgi:hypothetical protein